MNRKYFAILSALILIAFAGCQPTIEDFPASNGNADFTRYVALGNSLTAGYADGALYKSAQANSYPAILARQLAKVGGGAFVQPVVDNEIGLFGNKRVLGYATDCKGVTSLSPVIAEGTPVGLPGALAPVGYPVQNLGVPGAKAAHLIFPGYGNPAGLLTQPPSANPYFVRFASSATTSVLADAMAQNPTFFSLWIGNNDVLGYALAGGENNVGESITSMDVFNFAYNTLVETLTSGGAKGVVANIPDITSIPFFNTVPAMGLVLTEEQAAQLNGAYAQVENYIRTVVGIPNFSYGISFKAGVNPFVVEDRNFPYPLPKAFRVRQAKPGELILLTVPQDSLKCAGMGTFSLEKQRPYGIPQNFVLDEEEVQNIKTAVANMNATIKNLADQKGLAFVDVATLLESAKTGLVYDGITFSTTFVTGGIFSLDGVHMNQRGAAIVANAFIEAINKKYGASIPKADITAYPGIVFP